MLTRIYIGIWLLTGLSALTVFLTGYLNAFILIGFGIIFQALVFIGMIAVVPSMVGQKPTGKLKNRKI
jgi:hypothetical protein